MIFTIFDLSFLVLDMLVCVQAYRLRIKQVFLLHMFFFVAFVPGLEAVAPRLSNIDYYSYFATHLACLAYLVMFCMIGVVLRDNKNREQLYLSRISWVSDHEINIPIFIWVVFQFYLIGNYGLASMYIMSTSLDQPIAEVDYSVNSLSMLFFYGALGAVFVHVAKAAFIPRHLMKIYNLIPVLLFLVVFVALGGGGGLGVRRVLMVFVMYYILLFFIKVQNYSKKWLLTGFKKILLVVVVVAVGSIYYQGVRVNIQKPEVYENLLSSSFNSTVTGVLAALTPDLSNEEVEAVPLIREGPFVLIAQIINARAVGKSTDGELLVHELLKSIPRTIYPDKSEVDVDEIIAERMDLYPNTPYLKLDLSTSVLAILYSDFGILGVLLAPLLIAAAINFFVYLISNLYIGGFVLATFAGGLVFMICCVESGLVAIVGTVRDIVAVIVMIVSIKIMYKQFKGVVIGCSSRD